MSEWRPIETAPKDGSFLVYLSEPMLGRHVHSAEFKPNYRLIGSNFDYDCPKPTHWMPFPTPPTE